MMPEVRVALFGANPNRKFLDWKAPAYQRRTPLLFFIFCQMKAVIPLVCEMSFRRKRVVVVWCVAVFFLCIKGPDRRCDFRLQTVVMVYSAALLHGSHFTRIDEIGWFATSRPNVISLHDKLQHLCHRFPNSIPLYPTFDSEWGIVLLMDVCSN